MASPELTVKQFRSRSITVIAWLYLLFPITFHVVSSVLYDVPWRSAIQFSFTATYLTLSVLGIWAGYGMMQMARWAWPLFVVVTVAAVLESISLMILHGATKNGPTALLMTFFLYGWIFYRVKKEFVVPYVHPKVRWWESNTSSLFQSEIKIIREDKREYIGEVLDLSSKGCFVKLQDEFDADEEVDLYFNAFGQGVWCEGTVVWRAKSAVTHPKGLGIKFYPLGKRRKRVIRMAIHRLKKIGELRRTKGAIPTSKKEFFSNLAKLQSVSAVVVENPKTKGKNF